VQVYIYIYSLHLALTVEYLLSMICIIQKKAVSLNRSFRQTTNSQICIIQKKAVSLNRSFRQTTNSQKVTEKRRFCNLSCTP